MGLEWAPDGESLVLTYAQTENELFSVDYFTAKLRLDRAGAVLDDGRCGGGWSSGPQHDHDDDREEWRGDRSPSFRVVAWSQRLDVFETGASSPRWSLPMAPGVEGGRWAWSPKSNAIAVLSFVPKYVCKGRFVKKAYTPVYEVWRLDEEPPRAQRWPCGAVDAPAAAPVWVGKRAVAACADQLAIFDPETPDAETRVVKVRTTGAAPRPFGSRDPDKVIVPAGTTVSTVNVRTRRARRWERRMPKPHRQHFSPDSRRVLVERDRQLRLDDLERRQCCSKVKIPKGERPYLVRQVAWFPDGGLVAAARAVIRLWDARTGEALPDLERRASGITWLPDGHLLVHGGDVSKPGNRCHEGCSGRKL